MLTVYLFVGMYLLLALMSELPVILELLLVSVSVDIWSVGCIMGELLKGKVLFPGNDCILR